MADMVVRWSGEAISATRINKSTGQPQKYTLTVFEDGQASCSCPAFILNGINNPNVAPEDKLRAYRCKHLQQAFLDLGDPREGPRQNAKQSTPKRKAPESKAGAHKKVPSDIALDPDDFVPITRRY